MGKTAVITGATSGIGAEYARKLGGRGYDLILTGRRQAVIQKLADDLSQKYNIKTRVILAELSDDADIQKVVEAVKTAENLEFLINNAGFEGKPMTFMEKDLAGHEQMMKVLMTVPLRLISAALPQMTQNKRGTIINISSSGAFFPLAEASIYVSSKAFVKLFSESLALEVKEAGIKVQAVCPGFIETDFFRDFSQESKKQVSTGLKFMSPAEVVECSLKELNSSRTVCIPGTMYQFFMALTPFLPRSFINNRMNKK
jgi:uncharacterized protein